MKWKHLIRLTLFLWLATLFALSFIFVSQKEKYKLPQKLFFGSVEVLSEVPLNEGSIEQGVLYFEDTEKQKFYFSSNQSTVSKFDYQWNLIETANPEISGITRPHIGILARDKESIWGGVIDLDDYPYGSDTRIINFNPDSLDVLAILDFSPISKYVDAFDVEDNEFWIAYKDFVKVYLLTDGELELVKSFRVLTGTPQGLRLTKNKMCVVGESVTMMVRKLRNGIYCYSRDNLIAFESSFLASLIVFIDEVLYALNYRFNHELFNIYYSKQVNKPQSFWSFGFPQDNVDNEGFSFFSVKDGIIWVSDEIGDTARQLKLTGF